MISDRTIRKWRADALMKNYELSGQGDKINIDVIILRELVHRILRLTQEILDLHLLRKI